MDATQSLAAAQAAQDGLPRLLELLGRPSFPAELARFLRDETGSAAATIREIREDGGEECVVAATTPGASPPTALPVPGSCGRGEVWIDDAPSPGAANGGRPVVRSTSALVERAGARAIVASLLRAVDGSDGGLACPRPARASACPRSRCCSTIRRATSRPRSGPTRASTDSPRSRRSSPAGSPTAGRWTRRRATSGSASTRRASACSRSSPRPARVARRNSSACRSAARCRARR